MSIPTEKPSITEDWRNKTECFPFEDSDNHYIVVESAYETTGGEKEKRLGEAQFDGVFKLLKFYGKDVSEADGIFRVSKLEDYIISLRSCERMKVLVSVPKFDFSLVDDDPSSCSIDKPVEGNLSAFIALNGASEKINELADQMQSLSLILVRSDKFISNVNVPREIKRLRQAATAIKRYISLNNIAAFDIEDPECVKPAETERFLEIGYTYDYNAIYALVENEQHTIGYDCFLQTSVLNHITTLNYLSRIDSMLMDLENKKLVDFDVFNFFETYTLPLPDIKIKQNATDGIEKYDEHGNLSAFANMAKLVTLDLDINLCKTEAEKTEEDQTLYNKATRLKIAEARNQTSEFVGDFRLSSPGVKRLRGRLKELNRPITADPNKEYASERARALGVIYDEVLDRINLGCVLEETIQCLLQNMISEFGQGVINEPDLEKVFRIVDVSLGGGKNGCDIQKCDGTFDVGFKIGLPMFQGLEIPSNFPTTDFLASTMDTATVQLYNTVVTSLTSLILGILENLCELILDPSNIADNVVSGFKGWIAATVGVDVGGSSQMWADALTTLGGAGFMGAVGNAISKIEGSMSSAYMSTGIALNIPNSKGQVETQYITPEAIVTFFSGVSKATDDLEVILSVPEVQSIYRGDASEELYDLAYRCVTRNGNDIFQSRQDFEDIFEGMGRILKPVFLTTPSDTFEDIYTPNICNLDDDGDVIGTLDLIRSMLEDKDSDITADEINEVFEKERQRKKDRLLALADTLENYQAGTMLPSFPNILGSNGLIPKLPPIIEEANKTFAMGCLAPAINNFNNSTPLYGEIYKEIFKDGSNQQLFGGPNRASSFNVYTDEEDFPALPYILGYISDEQIENAATTQEATKIELGPYEFGRDIDVTGIDGKGGLHGSKGPKNRNKKGEAKDDELFEKLVRDLEPYVANSTHDFNNFYFQNFVDGIGELGPDDLGNKKSISGARAYAYLLILKADYFQFIDIGDNERFEEVNPYWNSNSYGNAIRYQDPQSFRLKVILNNEGENKNTNPVTIEVTQFTDPVIFEPRDEFNLVKVDTGWGRYLDTTPLYAQQMIEDYTIGTQDPFYARKISTGALRDMEYKYLPVLTTAGIDYNASIPITTIESSSTEEILNKLEEAAGIGLFSGEAHVTREQMLKNMAERVGFSKYSQDHTTIFNNMNLQYPYTDILQYEELQEFTTSLISTLAQLSLSNDYCDTMSAARRGASISSVKMLIRTFIAEMILISIHVADTFDRRYMESDLFVSSILNNIKQEVQTFQSAFSITDASLFQDIKDTISRYYEIADIQDALNLTQSSQFKKMILDELKKIMPSLESALKLSANNSESWDDYIVGTIIPEVYDDVANAESANAITTYPYVFVKTKDEDVYSYELRYIAVPQEDGGYRAEGRDDMKLIEATCRQKNIDEDLAVVNESDYISTSEETFGPYDFGDDVDVAGVDSQIMGEDSSILDIILPDLGYARVPYHILGDYNMEEKHPWLHEILEFVNKSNEKAKKDPRSNNPLIETLIVNHTGDFRMAASTLEATVTTKFPYIDLPLRKKFDAVTTLTIKVTTEDTLDEEAYEAALSARATTISEREEEIWSGLKQELLETEEYKFIFYKLVPLNNMISSLALYEYTALSDSAIYPQNVDGVSLFDMLGGTKLSILQTFASSIYGGGKINYQDPFT